MYVNVNHVLVLVLVFRMSCCLTGMLIHSHFHISGSAMRFMITPPINKHQRWGKPWSTIYFILSEMARMASFTGDVMPYWSGFHRLLQLYIALVMYMMKLEPKCCPSMVWRLAYGGWISKWKPISFFSIGDGFFRLFFRKGKGNKSIEERRRSGDGLFFFLPIVVGAFFEIRKIVETSRLGSLFWSWNRWNWWSWSADIRNGSLSFLRRCLFFILDDTCLKNQLILEQQNEIPSQVL